MTSSPEHSTIISETTCPLCEEGAKSHLQEGSIMIGYIHSTESFGTVDGPGVRFVIFFQGCPMRCLYCHNPDSWQIRTQLVPAGTPMTAAELLELYERNKEFYQNGGITCTGGEPLMQMGFLTELFSAAKQRGIHTCLDTSGIVFSESRLAEFDALMQVTDLVMLDIKHIDDEKHRELTGHSNAPVLAFAQYLSDKGIPVWIRHVIVPGWTDSEAEQDALGYFLGGIKTLKALDVLPYHTMGVRKYESLGIPYPLEGVPAVTPAQAGAAREVILKGLKRRLRDNILGKQ